MPEPAVPSLTRREREILALVAEGDSNKAVAEKLFTSKRTVDWHLVNVYEKLGVSNRVQALRAAQRTGLLTPEGSEKNHAA